MPGKVRAYPAGERAGACVFYGSMRTPGLRTPAGSTAALAPRSAAANGSGRWRSYQGRWSRPTAWWWVIVPPAAITASRRRRLDLVPLLDLAAAPRRGDDREVRRRAVRIDVGEAARQTRRARRRRDARTRRRSPGARVHHRGVELREPVPGDRRLEGVAEDAQRRRTCRAGRARRGRRCRHAPTGSAPAAPSTGGFTAARLARRRRGRSPPWLARRRSSASSAIQRPSTGWCGRLEAEDQERLARRPGSGERRLGRVEQPAVGRVQARLRERRAPPRRRRRSRRRRRPAESLQRGRS